MSAITSDEATRFFDAFVEAFATFDGATVAARYEPPFLAVDADGVATAFSTREEIARYFQGFLDDYHAQGSRSCRYRDLETTAAGAAGALLTVTWELLRADGSVAQAWRESYLVVRKDGALRVASSIDHADARDFDDTPGNVTDA